MPTVRIDLLDEVNCKITGLSKPHLDHFCSKYAILTEGYYFNPKYKLGSWDGKIRYFSAHGNTYVYLLEEIVPVIVDLGYGIDIEDHRVGHAGTPELITKDIFANVTPLDGSAPLELRDYQVNIVNNLITAGNGVALAATGSGKTIMCAALAVQYTSIGFKTLVVTPSQDLVGQTRDEFANYGIATGEYSGDSKNYNSDNIVISTWQALQYNPTVIQGFQVVIVDEAHGLRGAVLTKIMNEYGSNIVHRFGVTGTLPKGKTDAMAVRIAVGAVRDTITAAELIELGVLATIQITVKQFQQDFKSQYEQYLELGEFDGEKPMTYAKFKNSYFPDYPSENNFLKKHDKTMEAVVHEITGLTANTLVLVDGVAFGKKLASMIPNAVFVHGKDKKKARKVIYDTFATHDDIKVIATVGIMSTGLNIKRIFNMCLVDIGKSFTRVIQSIGRGLRKAVDKSHVNVYDLCSDLKYSKQHLTERIHHYNEAQYPHTKIKIDLHNSIEGLEC